MRWINCSAICHQCKLSLPAGQTIFELLLLLFPGRVGLLEAANISMQILAYFLNKCQK